MKLCSAGLAIALFTSSYCSALPPNKEQHKDRVMEQKLSNKDHEMGGEHNSDYDHDAFLGQKDAQAFEELSPEESKEKLGIIVDKIDRDHDGFVSEEELQHWIQYVQKKYVIEDTERMWKEHQVGDGKLTWEAYNSRTYGYDHEHDEEDKEMAQRDKRRFGVADKDGDGELNFEEFTAFIHPEDFEHMMEVVVLETMEDIDKDKDGKISLEEYIADIYDEEDDDDDDDDDEDADKDGVPDWVESEKDQFKHFRDKDGDGYLNLEEVRSWVIPDDYDNSKEETNHLFRESDTNRVGDMWPNKDEEEPEWVKGEREQFSSYRDANGDGFMDKEEVKNWIIPPNYDHSEAEAKHLIYETDDNKDNVLTKQEILDKYDIFVGSQATDFGEALTRHDEF